MRGKKLTQDEIDVITLLWGKGRTVRQIAAVIGRGKSAVAPYVRDLNAGKKGIQQVLDMGQGDADE